MKYLLTLMVIISGFSSLAQKIEWEPFTREIKINTSDSVIKARIMINSTEVKVVDEYTYYWHSKGQINRNMGGYTGDILHGLYMVFNTNKHLITQGKFDKGLKSGIWKRWYGNGNIKAIENWKNGLLHGQLKVYHENGTLEKVIDYKQGQTDLKEEKTMVIFNLGRDKPDSDTTKSDTLSQPIIKTE